jgi:hypothetical protein
LTRQLQPGTIVDPLTEIARDGARRMLAAATGYGLPVASPASLPD